MYRTVYIHIVNLQDGSPYGTPPSSTIMYEVPSGGRFIVERLAVTRSRVMMRTSVQRGNRLSARKVQGIVVWDMETGNSVSTI